jgi:hypothetical protein
LIYKGKHMIQEKEKDKDNQYIVSENIIEILCMLGVENSYDPLLFNQVISSNVLKKLDILKSLNTIDYLNTLQSLNTLKSLKEKEKGIILGENTNCCPKCLRFYYVDLNSSPHRCGKGPCEETQSRSHLWTDAITTTNAGVDAPH